MKTKLTVSFVLIVAVALFADQFSQGNFYVQAPFKLIFGHGASSDFTMSKASANTVNVDTGNTLNVVSADGLKVNSIIVPQTILAKYEDGAAGNATDRVFFLADAAYQVTACSQIHSVAAGGASSLQVVKDTGTTAPGAGTDLLTNNTNAGFDLNATANTLQAGTLSVTVTDLQLAAGDRLSVDYANAIQSSAGVRVTCTLKRI